MKDAQGMAHKDRIEDEFSINVQGNTICGIPSLCAVLPLKLYCRHLHSIVTYKIDHLNFCLLYIVC